MKQRVLIVGIDGGTWTVLKPAMEQGYMPFLKSLVDNGASGILESTIPAITPAAWGSFQTGMNPGENGVHDFFQWNKKEKKATIINSTNLKETIWEVASRAGRRVGVVNVPMTYPPKKINGYLVTGFLTPSPESAFTFPPELKSELLDTLPEYKILNLDRASNVTAHENFAEFIKQMTDDLRFRSEISEYIFAKESLDLFMVHFQATDVVQHQFWSYLTESHPLYDPGKRRYLFENFYAQLDRQMQRVYEAFWSRSGQPGLTVVVSDHGFQTNNMVVNLGLWLKQHGYLKVNFSSNGKKPLIKKMTSKLRIGKLVSHVISKKRMSHMEHKVLNYSEDPYDWGKSKAYARAGNCEGFIYLLEEEDGKRNITEKRIIEELQKIDDPAGHRVVKKIYKKHEIFRGKNVEIMPDLVVEPEDGYSFHGTYRQNAELFHKVHFPNDIHVGKHHKDGIFVAHGKDAVKQGGIRAKIEDIAPTLLYAMSLPMRRDCDGRVLGRIFTDDFLATYPEPTYYDPEMYSESQDGDDYSNDQQQIENRLKNLGYL